MTAYITIITTCVNKPAIAACTTDMSNWQATCCIWPIGILVVTWQFWRGWGSIVDIVTCCRPDGSGSNPGREVSRLALGLIQPPVQWAPGYSGQGVRLTTHQHLLPRIKMGGAESLHPICAFIAWTGKTLPFCINFNALIKWVDRIPKGIFLFTNESRIICVSHLSKVVVICQEYNVIHDRNCTARNASCF